MQRDSCVELGYVSKAHGINGEVKAKFDVHDIFEYKNRKSVFLAKRGEALTSYLIRSFQIRSGTEAILSFEGVNDRDAADALRSSSILIPLTDLPALDEGQFYYFEINGFLVVDEVLGDLGTVLKVLEMPAQDVIVMDYQENEVLIPMTHEIVIRADKSEKKIFTRLPEGLIETYM